MKKHLTKIYNIFKQIEALNGVSGWDQDKSFYYFYESNDLVRCWELLYGLFSENKQLDIKKFGVDLNITQLRKLAFGRSCVYEFDSIGVTPVLVATFERNGKHQISGKVEIEETSISEEKTVEFIDGNKIDEDFEEPANEHDLQFMLKTNLSFANKFESLLKTFNVDLNWVKLHLIKIDALTIKEFRDLDYIQDRIETHKSYDEDEDEDDEPTDESEAIYALESGISLAFSFFDYVDDFSILTKNEFVSLINRLKLIDGLVIFTNENGNLSGKTTYGIETEVAEKLNELLHSSVNQGNFESSNITLQQKPNTETIDFISIEDIDAVILVSNYVVVCYHDDNSELIEINDQEELQEYQQNYNDNRLFVWKTELKNKNLSENFKNELKSKIETFQINGVTPDTLENLEEVSLFLDYLYDDCGLIGRLHPDDSFNDYVNKKGNLLFTDEQQLLYDKYIDDMFEMDSDGESLFVQAGYEDVYDYCMNYRNDSYNLRPY